MSALTPWPAHWMPLQQPRGICPRVPSKLLCLRIMICRHPHIEAAHHMVQVAFVLPEVTAIAAVQATRASTPAAASTPKDILVLHSSGRLVLYVGADALLAVRVQPAKAPSPYARLAGLPTGDTHAYQLLVRQQQQQSSSACQAES